MSVLWQLESNGDRRTLKDWGLEQPSLRLSSFAADEFTASRADGSATDDPLFQYDNPVSLWRGGVCWFRGRVSEALRYSSRKGERQRLHAAGPWADLERITFAQVRVHWPAPLVPGSGLAEISTYTAVLFQTMLGGSRTLAGQIQDVLTFAAFSGAPIAAGEIDADINVPWEEAQDLSCAAVIRRAFRWAPDAVAWFDYAPAIPALHIKRRPNLAAAAVPVGSLEGFSFRPRPDLLVRGVSVIVRTPTFNAAGDLVLSYTSQLVGATDGLRRVGFTLRPNSLAQEIPADLAAQYLASLSTLHWEGSVQIREQEVSGVVRLGQQLNLTGGHAAWASMGAMVEEVAYDLDTGSTTARFGPPVALGMGDFAAQQNPASNTAEPTGDAVARITATPTLADFERYSPAGGLGGLGAGGEGAGYAGLTGSTSITLTLCGGGTVSVLSRS